LWFLVKIWGIEIAYTFFTKIKNGAGGGSQIPTAFIYTFGF
jgi:hypothetical protein